MGINYKGSQGQTEGAVVLLEKEEQQQTISAANINIKHKTC